MTPEVTEKLDDPRPVAAAGQGRRLSAFGLEIDVEFPLPGGRVHGTTDSKAELVLRLVPHEELAPLTGDERILRYLATFDDCAYAMLEGPDGDVLIWYGYRALFHLSADQRVLRCAPTVQSDPTWQRVLLDTVLWTVSLLRGYELLHASAVETPRGILAFVAMSGGGKTSLAAEYIRRGASFFCDDRLALDDSTGRVLGHPGPPLINLPHELQGETVGEAEAIADFGDERWIVVDTPPAAAQPIVAVVLLDRTVGRQTSCAQIPSTNLALLPHAVGFPHMTDRSRRRFELFGAMASTTPVLHLTADPSLPTEFMADLIDEQIARR